MDNFYDQLKNTLDNGKNNISVTENGALGFKTSGKALLDLNFAVSSLRSATEAQIEQKFAAALGENFALTVIWLFFARDVRGGLGERRLFRVCMRYLARNFTDVALKLLPLIAEYGRWDDLVDLAADNAAVSAVIAIIRDQLTADMKNLAQNKPVSLLAKWLPSENTSSHDTRELAHRVRGALGITPRQYRVMLSALRKKIGVIERQMSASQWDEIKYSAVPSRANLIYNSAFLRHDETRRRDYLAKLKTGEEKINASVLFPHDIVHKYAHTLGVDESLEALWKALPNTVPDGAETIVVADGSGSMTTNVGGTSVTAMDVADALAIYFAERLPVPFKNRYITFSATPKLVNLAGAGTLRDKLRIARQNNEVANTNIEAVFDLILDTAVKNHLVQAQLPKNILIISDMEFDTATVDSGDFWWSGRRNTHFRNPSKTLFQEIGRKFSAHGYRMPRLVFWNVNSRTGTIPVKENDLGVALVSGFSPNVARMVMSGKLDPFDALVETLQSPRYDAVREALDAN